MEQVIELVSFKLVHGTTQKDFIEAAEKSQKFVSTLPGFLYRSLSHNEEQDSWTDTVYWRSMEDAKSAGEQFMSCADCQPLMAMITPDSVNMQHQQIKMDSECQK
ncbi:antibiotic biosynthesis monooxygenase family protein [Vibrio profundi]|uniref:antibiotic biosynthesis monooxygenase family protein n=1 Tax=Vibrio profundi TaxID=1774960 RepID=UPI0037351108